MLDHDLVTITDRFIAALSAGDWRQLQNLLAPNLRYSETDGEQQTGAEAYIQRCQTWKRAFPDGTGTIRLTAAEGATIAQEVLWEGVHKGDLPTPGGEIPATGRRIAVTATLWYRCDHRQITAIHHYVDRLTLLQQLGMLAAPQPAGEHRLAPERSEPSNQAPAC